MFVIDQIVQIRRRALATAVAVLLAVMLAACGTGPTDMTTGGDRPGLGGPSLAIGVDSVTGATIETSQDDYAPGEVVHLTGWGWAPNETVRIHMTEEPDTHADVTQDVEADGNGEFSLHFYDVQEHDLGVTFTLTATGLTSGSVATASFTDGNIRIRAKPAGVEFILAGIKFTNTTCTAPGGTPDSNTVGSTTGQSKTYGAGNTESFRLEAALTSTSGGAFLSWDPSSGSAPYTQIGSAPPGATTSRMICVPGFTGGGTRDYFANYTAVPDLKITKSSSPSTFTVGSNATYTLHVENVGQVPTSGTVTVTDTLPAGLTFVSVSATGWTCSGTSIISCTRSNALAAGSAYPDIVITVTPTAAAIPSVTNRGWVDGGGDVSPGNNSSTVTTTVAGVVDLSIDKSHSGDFTRGNNEQYALVVTNSGSAATSAQVTVLDTLPAGLTFISGTGTGWNACTASGQVVTCTRPSANAIAAGGAAPGVTLTVSVGAATASSITNRARVSGGGEPAANKDDDCTHADNCDSDPTTVVNANSVPTAEAGGPYSGDEGSAIALSGATAGGTDTPLTYKWTYATVSGVDAGATCSFSDDMALNPTITCTDDGTFEATLTVTDKDGETASDNATVNVANKNPTATADGPYSGAEGAAIALNGSGDDPGNNDDPHLTYLWTVNTAGIDAGGTCTFDDATKKDAKVTCTDDSNGGTFQLSLTVSDDDGGSSTASNTTLTVTNANPTASAGGPYSGAEGAAIQLNGSGDDPGDNDDPHLTYLWTVNTTGIDAGGTCTFDDATNKDAKVTCTDDGSFTLTLTVSDDDGGTGSSNATLTVANVNPVLGPITAPVDPVNISMAVSVSAPFTDQGTNDTHTGVIDWGDGTTSPAVITESNGSGTASGSHFYGGPGVYTIKMTVTDDDGGVSNQSVFQYVVVFDPSAGFVTGGGWINSPPGAYAMAPLMVGKANFGFVSKYQKGATVPSGNTEFQFHAASMNFKSTFYQWLVVQGSAGKASYKGEGTINGAGAYGFLLSMLDGGSTGDKFRIKIWDKATGVVVYDNQLAGADDATASQLIAGGSIVIHTGK